jgi:hypothetical protein
MRKIPAFICSMFIAATLVCACASVPGKAKSPAIKFAEVADDPKEGIQLELNQVTDGETQFSLMYPDLGPVAIRGTAERDGDGWLLKFERLDWFNAWPDGWTEASFILEGESSLIPSAAGDVWILSLRTMPKLDAVRSAAMRYFDTYVRGQKGIDEFSHRWDRIQAVCRDLFNRFDGSSLARRPDVLRRYLFPEVYGYDEPPVPGFHVVFGQGQEWNADYSAEHFSQGLRQIRENGTMLRDYKESPGLWQLALSWQDFWEHRGYSAGLRRLTIAK